MKPLLSPLPAGHGPGYTNEFLGQLWDTEEWTSQEIKIADTEATHSTWVATEKQLSHTCRDVVVLTREK